MVNFRLRSAITLCLGMLFGSFNSCAAMVPKSHQTTLVPTVITDQVNEIVNLVENTIYKGDLYTSTCFWNNKAYFEKKDVLMALANAKFNLVLIDNGSPIEVKANILFYVLHQEAYGNGCTLGVAGKEEMFTLFLKLAEGNEDVLNSLINSKIEISDSGERYSLITFALKNKCFAPVSQILICKGFDKNVLKVGNIVAAIAESGFIEENKCTIRLEMFFEKMAEFGIIKFGAADLKKLIEQEGARQVGVARTSILERAIYDKKFSFVLNILKTMSIEEFGKIDDKDLLLHKVITSFGYKSREDRSRKEVETKEALELIELLVKYFKVDINKADPADKNRTPLLVLSRDLEGSVEHGNNPRRILTDDAIKILDFLLDNRANLACVDKFNKNFIEWLIIDCYIGKLDGDPKEFEKKRGIFRTALFNSRVRLLNYVLDMAWLRNNLHGVLNNLNNDTLVRLFRLSGVDKHLLKNILFICENGFGHFDNFKRNFLSRLGDQNHRNYNSLRSFDERYNFCASLC